MMKFQKKALKITAVLLSALLVIALFVPFASAETELLPGQKEMFTKTVSTPPVQDGILNGHKLNGKTVDEYGSNGPTFCLSPADYRALDLNGNPLDVELPSYIYLYMAKDADALYVGMEIQEKAHSGDTYEFTTFLGFGDSKDADTMNSGIFTTYKMDNGNSANFDPGTWMDTQVTALSAQKVAADGTITDTTASRKFNLPVEYTLPAWASETEVEGKPVTFFEAELDFEDAMLGSGLEKGAQLPDYAYFAFELGIFNGSTKIGKIVFNNDMTGKDKAPDGEIKTVPHVINLKEEFVAGDASNASLAALTVANGTLSPAFDPAQTNYTLSMPNGVSSANVTATPAVESTRMSITGADAFSQVSGAENVITIKLVAQNGYTRTYTLNVEFTFENTDIYVDAAGDDATGNGSKSKPYATIEKALATMAESEWEADAMATIHVNGTHTATAPGGIMFGVKTIFTKGATRLPITIKGDSKTADIINPYLGNAACTNNYTFSTLCFPIDQNVSSARVYAGSGNVRFENVNWTTASAVASSTTVFFGDTWTAKVFEGWTATEIAKAKSQNKNGNIDTSITLASTYWIAGSNGYYLAAIGDTGGWSDTTGIAVKSSEVEVSAIIDNVRISKFAIFTGGHSSGTTANTTEYAKANIFMYGDDASTHLAGIDRNGEGRVIVNADVEIGIFGGQSIGVSSDKKSSTSYLRGGRFDTVNGDLTITVESGTWQYVQGGLSSMTINGNYEINFGGTAYINRDGKDSSGTEYGEGFYGYCGNGTDAKITGTVVHNIYGGYIKNYYGIHGKNTINNEKIVHNISGGTIDNYYGGGTENSTVVNTTVENNISGGTITTYYGAGLKDSKQKVNKVINNISGDATINTFYGTYHGTIGTIENNISGGTFTSTYNGTYNSNNTSTTTVITGGEFKSSCYIAFFGTNTTNTVKTTISGGTFNGTYLGSYGGYIEKMETTISGGTFTGSNTVYLGAGSTTWPSAVGNIENTITGGNFTMRVYGGGWGGCVTGNITNNIVGGNFASFYGGINTVYHNYSKTTNSSTGKISVTCNMIGRESFTVKYTLKDGTASSYTDYKTENCPYDYKLVGGKIINNFGKEGEAGPSFSSYIMCGNLAGTHQPTTSSTIENTIYSGTFNGTFYGGGDTANETITSITNNFKGGTFNYATSGGSYNAVVGTITNNIEAGTFNGIFFGGSRRANITGDVINNISGGTWSNLFFGGSDHNTASATAEVAPVTYTIGGSIKNTITGGTFKTGASGAGFGTINGNVENTLKGNPDFQLGYYGVQATIIDTVVKGNVLNLVTKDENGIAPLFPAKNQAIEYKFDNADHQYIYQTDGSNIGFAAVGASGTVYTDSTKTTKGPGDTAYTEVHGYVETIIEAGHFDGHYYLGGGIEIYGANKDGYGAINIVRGDPVFDYVWAGGCVSSTRGPAYKTYNEVNGGTFNKQFTSYNRTATAGTNANACEVVTVIRDGVFNSTVALSAPWSDSHANQHQRTAPYTLTIEGGTFNNDVYGLSYRNASITGPYIASENGAITININGGTFKNIYGAGNVYTASKFKGNATINIAPTKGNVTILGKATSRFANEIVNLAGGEYQLILGEKASVVANSASGDVKIGQNGTWKKQTYVTLPAGNTANVTVSGAHVLEKADEVVTAVKGGIQMNGATMILTDRVAVRALFDKASVEALDNFTFTFTMDGTVLASGDKSDLVLWDANTDYYCIVLAKIGASDFTKNVSLTGDLVWDATFSIQGLAEIAEDAWVGNDEGVQLAKAMQNFATIVADPTATLPFEMQPDMSKLEGFTASASKDEGAIFNVSGKGLVMGNAVGIRIYGTSEKALTKEDLIIKVNGSVVTHKAVLVAGAENAYTIDLYVNAKNMSSELKLEIIDKASGKACLNMTDRVDAIAAAYPATHEKYAQAQQLLVYIQAAVAYATK